MALRPFGAVAPTVAVSAYVDEAALLIGAVEIGPEASVWPFALARGDVNQIRIGAYTNIQDGAILHVSHDGPFAPGGFALTVGDYVTVGHRAILHGCTVGDECLIGMAATVLDGARLEPRCLLAAGALVPSGKVLRGGYLWAGMPAKEVRPLTEDELRMLRYSAEHYAKLKERHRAGAAGMKHRPRGALSEPR